MGDAVERLYERVLVVRCQAGDEAALTELIARYSPRVRFYLRKMAGDEAADDLLQDVWVDVFANVSRLKDPGAFGGWVYQIARHKAYRQLRRRRVPIISVDDELADEARDEQNEWTAEDVQQLRAAMDELAAEHREVLLLQFVEEMSYEQIAAVIACPIGTVRSRIHHAKRALRRAMERKMIRKDERT